ncbi:MAG: hypothetical protein AB7O96_01215 [Pseudobdellovibrionaceae bacterium]
MKTIIIILLAHFAFEGCSVKNPTEQIVENKGPENPTPDDPEDGPVADKKMKVPVWQSAQGGAIPHVTAGGHRASASLGVSVSQKSFNTVTGHKVFLSIQSKAQ